MRTNDPSHDQRYRRIRKALVTVVSDDRFIDALATAIESAVDPPVILRPPEDVVAEIGSDTPASAPALGEPALLLTTAEAARLCGISRSMAYGLCRSGEWPTVRIGTRGVRVPRQGLLDWIRSHVTQGGAYDWNW